MIHGHLHKVQRIYYDILRELPQVLNAGVDFNDLRPVPLEKLIENNDRFFERTREETVPYYNRGRSRIEGAMPTRPNFKPVPLKPEK